MSFWLLLGRISNCWYNVMADLRVHVMTNNIVRIIVRICELISTAIVDFVCIDL